MKPVISTLMVAVFIICSLSSTFAQTEALVITSTTLDQEAKTTSSKMYLKDDIMVTETPDDKKESVVMFDAGKETLYIINHKKKEYIEMTRQDMEALNTMLQQQLAAMEQQLAMLPESQRKMIREQMGVAFGGNQTPAEYSLEESGVNVKEWETDKYVGMADGSKQSEIYVADYSELGQDAAQFEALGKFFEIMKGYMQSMSKSFSSAGLGFFGENMPGYKEGLPVKTILYNSKGEAISTTMVETMAEEPVEEGLFEIPENYKKKKVEELAKQ